MSIFENAREVANASVAPTVPSAAQNAARDALSQVAQTHDLATPELLRSLGATETPADGQDQRKTLSDRVGSALDVLKKFIPGEAVALFVPGVTIFKGWGDAAPRALITWFFVVLVLSVLFYLVAAATPAKAGDPVRIPNGPYFWWKLVALFIAYVVWALAFSTETQHALLAPFTHSTNADPHIGDVLGILTLVASPVLTVFDGFFKSFTPQQKAANA